MFILEGNIGAGKSTLITLLKKNLLEISCCQEPVESWQKTGIGGSLLEEFYKNSERWAYSMESFTLICRIKELSKQPYGKSIIERSIFSGFYCFAKNGYLNGSMSKIEWEIYNQLFNFFVQKKGIKMPLGFIYLKTDPKICFDRIQKRSRQGEDAISLDYLRSISDMHDQMLLQRKDLIPQLKNIPVLILDGNLNIEADQEALNQFVDAIRSFVDKHTIIPASKTEWQIIPEEQVQI